MSEHHSIRADIIEAFVACHDRELTEAYIEAHNNLLWDVPEIALIDAVPLYMLWCVEHIQQEQALIFEDTIAALNSYARAKDPTNPASNFRFQCNHQQKTCVYRFLQWCQSALLLDYQPTLDRALKNWHKLLGEST